MSLKTSKKFEKSNDITAQAFEIFCEYVIKCSSIPTQLGEWQDIFHVSSLKGSLKCDIEHCCFGFINYSSDMSWCTLA